MDKKAYYHLPGLFEFYELYKVFLPLFYNHREYFYDWCEIASIYGAPADSLWGGGRVGFGECDADKVLRLLDEYGISARLTFSNSLIREEDLSDRKCNKLCSALANNSKQKNGIIIHSDLLLNYIRKNYPDLYFVSSTTKVITDFDSLLEEINREEFEYVVPDFRLNKALDSFANLTGQQKDKIEFLCNEACYIACNDRRECYEAVSRKSLGLESDAHVCKAPFEVKEYRFSRAMSNPSFIGIEDIKDKYLPMGFSNFKIEGRGLGSAINLEFLLYYMTKPEYQIHVREEIYLDTMLDLF